ASQSAAAAAVAPASLSASPTPAGLNGVTNGGFETGTFSGWTTTGASTTIVTTAHTGTFAAELGSASPTTGNSTMTQTVTVPAAATLSFWYLPSCLGVKPTDREMMQVRNTSGTTLLSVLNVCSNSNTWTQVSRSLGTLAGQTVVLWFNNHDDNAPTTPTFTIFDDISVAVPGDDFSLGAEPPSLTVSDGSSASTTVTTQVTSGSTQPVALTVSGLPSGTTASFTPATVNSGAASTLTISAPTTTPPGTSVLTVTGAGPSATHTTTVSLTVTQAPPGLVQLSADPYTNAGSEHATEVEPDTFSHGSTVVSAFQAGRFSDGGSDDLGWATSTDGGQTWSNGFLPGITTSEGGTRWPRVSDPSVTYDAKFGQWVVSGLAVDHTAIGRGVSISRSPDGLTWANPVMAVTSKSGVYYDKDWIVCDNTPTSPGYGNCYVEFDNNTAGNTMYMLTSTDGGLTWSAPRQPANGAQGLGGQPLVQLDGTVVVPYLADAAGQIRAFVSTNSGATWGASVLVSAATAHTVAGNMRTTPLPSAEIDAAGTVYLAWQDCRFRTGCAANDIAFATSADGTTWSAVRRIPIDPVSSTVDHFIPGLAVDPATSGASAHLALSYYFFPDAACQSSSCQLDVGFVSSTDGGTTWSAPTQLAGPTSLGQIASTTEGVMVGDYISTSFVNGRALPAIAVGVAPTNGAAYNEAMYTVAGGLAAAAGSAPSTLSQASTAVTPPPSRPAPPTAS
ncbi:MAG: hypothetical protein ACRDZ8_16960, partial [Acidimicrobiales bacterium]